MMLVRRVWIQRRLGGHEQALFEGWFVLGVLPVYISQLTVWK